jgi:hypothetical protein
MSVRDIRDSERRTGSVVACVALVFLLLISNGPSSMKDGHVSSARHPACSIRRHKKQLYTKKEWRLFLTAQEKQSVDRAEAAKEKWRKLNKERNMLFNRPNMGATQASAEPFSADNFEGGGLLLCPARSRGVLH